MTLCSVTASWKSTLTSKEETMEETERYWVVRNDGKLYMECDKATAMRIMNDLNKRYMDTYVYHVEKA